MFSVSLTEVLIDRAIAAKADAIFVHHGFFGKNYIQITGALKRRLQKLLSNDISLFAYHLPLDAHETLGHNAQLSAFAGLKTEKPLECGFICSNPAKFTLQQVTEKLNNKLQVNYCSKIIGSGPFVPVMIG